MFLKISTFQHQRFSTSQIKLKVDRREYRFATLDGDKGALRVIEDGSYIRTIPSNCWTDSTTNIQKLKRECYLLLVSKMYYASKFKLIFWLSDKKKPCLEISSCFCTISIQT